MIFQSHLGLHCVKRLFFGPTNSSGIFHHEVTKVFAGLKGCVTIHDNLLVYGSDENEHNRNMVAMLERAKLKGVTLKLAKSTICAAEVNWFRWVFLEAGCWPTRTRYSTSCRWAGQRRLRKYDPCCRPRHITPSTGLTTWRPRHTKK